MVDLPLNIETVKGFLDPHEGELLYALALDCAPRGLCVEIGSYCGKSTIIIATACQRVGGTLVAIDHHRGSEENQPGEAYHDPDLATSDGEGMSSFQEFEKNIKRAGLCDTVVPVVAPSALAARVITSPVAFVFIDGGHSMPAALADYRLWATRLAPGGILAIHDVFPNSADGGRPPHEIYLKALHSGLFAELPGAKSLRVLERL